MNPHIIGLYTIVRRELIRMFRIASQVFLPPIITTLLYFLIFGSIIGQRIGQIDGISYTLFIAPGLVMMSVINNSYANVSNSLFSVRFQKSIEEILVSPMHYSLILVGYTLGGVFRGLIVALLVLFISYFFLDLNFKTLPMTLFIILLVSALFSLAGFTNGMLARNFDDVALIPTFVLTPLTYLGGVFYSTHMLSSFWQHATYLNPIFYMINALRHVMIGQQEININITISVIILLLIGLIAVNLILLKRGIGMRE